MSDKTETKSNEKTPKEVLRQEYYFSLASIFLPVAIAVVAMSWSRASTLMDNFKASKSVAQEVATSMKIGGLDFPLTIPSHSNLQIVGGGTRSKYGIAKIYAAGIYVEKHNGFDKLGSLLKQEKNLSTESGVTLPAENVYDMIINKAKFSKAISLQFLRDVDSTKVEESLQEELSKRLDSAALQRFVSALHEVLPPEGEKIMKGMEISMVCNGATIVFDSSYGQAKKNTLKDKLACPALFDVYLGKDAVSKKIKNGFGSSAVELFSS